MDMSYYNPRQKNLSAPRNAQINSISLFTCMWMGVGVGVQRGAEFQAEKKLQLT